MTVTTPEPRTVEVPAARLGAWLDGFARRNGAVVAAERDGGTLVLRTDRGGSAMFPPPAAAGSGDVATVLAALVTEATAQRRLAVVLVRRGGYAVGDLTSTGTVSLHASKNGSRYVQGRTAAGGQSQQRFARRRANQADALAGAAADAAVQVLGIHPRPVDVLVTGGDQALVDQVLADPRLRWLADLPERRNVDVGDPRKRTLEEAAVKAMSVPVIVTNSPGNGRSGPAD